MSISDVFHVMGLLETEPNVHSCLKRRDIHFQFAELISNALMLRKHELIKEQPSCFSRLPFMYVIQLLINS